MRDTEFEDKIRKCIEDVYCCKCNFRIEGKQIIELIGDGRERKTFIAYLYVHDLKIDPMHIIWEGDSEEAFLKYLKEDLLHRELIRSNHINITLQQ